MPVLLSGSNRNIFQRAKNYVTGTWAMIAIVLAFVFVTLLVFALPISQIIIGSLYIHSCPMNDLIPIYLIVAGILTFIFLIISIVKIFVANTIGWKFTQLVLGFICLGWFITGNVWSFRDRDIVQHDDPDEHSTYCEYSVYTCAYTTVFISYAYLFGSTCLTNKRSS